MLAGLFPNEDRRYHRSRMRAWMAVTRSVVASSALIASAAPARAEIFADMPAHATPGSLLVGEGWGCVLERWKP